MAFHCTDDTPVCRGCGRVLRGSPYFKGGRAYVADHVEARKNYYGGWVCSFSCDRRASLELEQSMPGHGFEQSRLGRQAASALARNWPESL